MAVAATAVVPQSDNGGVMNRNMMLGMQAANQAAARSRQWAMSTGRRNARLAFAAQQRRAASPLYRAERAMAEQVKQQQELREALRAASGEKLKCQPVPYSQNAAAMLFRSNRTDGEGNPQVVFQCHTNLPGSGTPATAILWTESGVDFVDFAETAVQEALARGRLFIFPAVIAFSDGEAYSILPAAHHDKGRLWSSGKDWLWSFATAGSFRGHPFVIGRGGIGTFIDPSLRHLVVARPQTFSDPARRWLWTGRSSLEEGGRLIVHAEALFESAEERAVKYLLPKIANAPGRVALFCEQRDDRGDPLAVYDMREGHRSASKPKPQESSGYRLADIGGQLHFIAEPNGKTSGGDPVFVSPANSAAGGRAVFQIVGFHQGKRVSFGLAANARDAGGRPIFFAPARAKVDGRIAIAFPLAAAAQPTEGSST